MIKQLLYSLLILLIGAAALAFADNCNYNGKCNVVAKSKVVQGYHVYNDYNRDIVRVLAVPVTSFGPEYYYKLGNDISEDRLVEKVSDRLLEKLKAEPYNAICAKLKREESQESTQPVEPVVEPVVEAELSRALKVVIDNSCVNCHNEKKASGGFNLVDYTRDGKPLTKGDWSDIYFAVEDGSMPKNNTVLPQESVNLIKKFVRGL